MTRILKLLVFLAPTTAACAAIYGATDVPNVQDGSVTSPDGSVPDGAAGDGPSTQGDGGVVPHDGPPADVGCPEGSSCGSACPDGGSTTISGTVYDPAGKNPLNNVAVYVPASTPLGVLPKGVPSGAAGCSCSTLFPTPAFTWTYTGADGTFTLANVPSGTSVPLVVQVGKWRRLVHVAVNLCADNPQPDRSLTLPSTVAAGDTNDNMPDIAVSTGAADTLECLFTRLGLPASEYVAGTGTTGHVHIFAGGDPTAGGGGGAGIPETPAMPGAPVSATSLWANQGQLMPFDLVMLSCEGAETYAANPPALEAYLNAGGRVFASHYHYAWFSGPLSSTQTYMAPADWSNLATWTGNIFVPNGTVAGGVVNTSFSDGHAMQDWLANVGALSDSGVDAAVPIGDAGDVVIPEGELPIYQSRFSASVGPSNTYSQAWISVDPTTAPGTDVAQYPTIYFSFNTPVTAAAGAYCGRAVFSDLHVGGAPTTNDMPPPPTGCSNTELSAQEKALEFMLFDLSSCLTTVTP